MIGVSGFRDVENTHAKTRNRRGGKEGISQPCKAELNSYPVAAKTDNGECALVTIIKVVHVDNNVSWRRAVVVHCRAQTAGVNEAARVFQNSAGQIWPFLRVQPLWPVDHIGADHLRV